MFLKIITGIIIYRKKVIKKYFPLIFGIIAICGIFVLEGMAAPPIPTLISPENSDWIAENIPTFIWSTVGDSVTYTIEYTADSSFVLGVMVVSDLNDTFYTTPTPLADTTFYWRVEAVDTNEERSGYQAYPFRFSIDTKKPSLPNLSYPNNYINDLTPTFIWSGATKWKGSPISYRLQCALNSGFTNIVIDTSNLSETNFTPIDLLSDTIYYFRVDACDLAGNNSGFQEHLAFTIDTTIPGTPSLLLPNDDVQINDNTPTLIWSSSTEPTVVYTVVVALDSQFTSTILEVSKNDTFYTIESPLADTIIFWKVRARDYAGNCSPFQIHPFKFDIDAGVPATPVLFSPENLSCINDSTPIFKWSSVKASPVRYTFQCALDSGFTNLVIDTSNLEGTDFTSEISLSNMTYFFRVSAFDIAGNCGNYQAYPFTFTIDTKPPSVPILISPLDSSELGISAPTFVWGQAIDSISSVNYTLQCSADSTFNLPTQLLVSGLTDTTYTVFGELENGLYYWRVEAIDAVNNNSGYQIYPFQFNIATETRLSLRAIMRGYYNPSTHLTPATGVRVELRDSLEPQNTVYSFPNLSLDSTGRRQKYKCEDLSSGYYYLVVKKINHLAVITDSTYYFDIGKLVDVDFTLNGVAKGVDPLWLESDGLYSLRGGDLDQDGVVFIPDYGKLAQKWATSDSIGDIDNNGMIFISDYNILAQNWAREDYLPEHTKTCLSVNVSQLHLLNEYQNQKIEQVATFDIRPCPNSEQLEYYADSIVTLEIVVSLLNSEYPFISYAVGNFLLYDTTVLSLIDYEDNVSYEELYESMSDMTDDGQIQYSRMKKMGVGGSDTGWIILDSTAMVPYKLIFKVRENVDSCVTELIFDYASLSDSGFYSIATESYNKSLTILGQGIEEDKVVHCVFEGLNIYPNPWYSKVMINYAIPKKGYVSLKVYDISGILVRTLVNKQLKAGCYTTNWNGIDNIGSKVSSGVYFLKFEAMKFKSVKKTLILKR